MLSMSFKRCLVKVMEVEWGVWYQNKFIFSTVHATWCRSWGVWHKEKRIGRKEITHQPILKHSSHNISGLPPRGRDASGNPLLDRQLNLSYSLWLYWDKLFWMYFCRKPTNATSFVLHGSHSTEWKNGGDVNNKLSFHAAGVWLLVCSDDWWLF